MKSLDKLLVSNLLSKEIKITKESIKNYKVLGIDEVGIAESIGSIFIGFYIETLSRKYADKVKDTKKLSNSEVISGSKKLTGFSLIKQITPEDIREYRDVKKLIRAKILEGLAEIPSALYDLVIIDGHQGLIPQHKLNKPILAIPKADASVYEVGAASIKAKEALIKEQEMILCKYNEKLGLNMSKLTSMYGSLLYKLIGIVPEFKYAFILHKIKELYKRQFVASMMKVKRELMEILFKKPNEYLVGIAKESLDSLEASGIISVYKRPNIVGTKTKFLRVCFKYAYTDPYITEYYALEDHPREEKGRNSGPAHPD